MRIRLQSIIAAIMLGAAAACSSPPQSIPTPKISADVTLDPFIATATRTPIPVPTSTETPTPTATAVAANTVVQRYTVRKGDTLTGIATHFNVSVADLTWSNGITNPNSLRIGQVLEIPAVNPADSPTQTPYSAAPADPGLVIDPIATQQGDTLLVRVANPGGDTAAGTFEGQAMRFAQTPGYSFALIGISRCAKAGAFPLTITLTDASGGASTRHATVSVTVKAFPVTNIVLPPGKGDLLDPLLERREDAQLAAFVNRFSPERLWDGVFRQPLVGIVSAPYGQRRSYNGGPIGACGHEGIDLAAPTGTPIHASAAGRVVFSGLTEVRGNMTVIDHGLGVFTGYYHQSKIDVTVDQMVGQGDVIGEVGTTGLSTGPHVHWSLWVNGEYVDPTTWTQKIFP